MGKKKDVIESIADHLPEGMDESTLEKIAELLSVTIKQKVQEAKADLTNKVSYFIRGNIDKLKEQAIKELELENPVYRNAQMFETVRSMFAVENTTEDEITGMGILASLGESLEHKNDVLLEQVNKLLKDNVKLKSQVKVAVDKSTRLEEQLEDTNEDLERLSESKGRNFSDTALVISQENFVVDEEESNKLNENHAGDNPWVDQRVLDKLKGLKN